MDNESPNSKDKSSFCTDLENWMGNLPQGLRAVPLIYLAIPGSHDSMTYSISEKSSMSPDAEPVLQYIKFLGPVLRYVMSRWSRTQNYDVTEQLHAGIRYFDLRLATKVGTDKLFIVHGLYGTEVGEVLNGIKSFLETHPREVVILDCQHFYAFGPSDHEKLMVLLTTTFGHRMMPYTVHMEHLSLEYMTTHFRYQVIVIYRSDAARFGQPLLWPSAAFPTPWPNTVSISKLFSKLDEYVEGRPQNSGFIAQCVLTPSAWFVCKNFLSTLKNQCALPLEKQKYQWLKRQKPGPSGVNIVIVDFIDLVDNQFCKEVINLNSKLWSDDAFEALMISTKKTLLSFS